jgi:hypothetical protein
VARRIGERRAVDGPAADDSVIVDIDGVLVLAHSENQNATAA